MSTTRWAALGLLILVVGCGKQTNETAPPINTVVKDTGDEPPAAAAGQKVVTVYVEGMHCDSCVQGISNRLAKEDYVRAVRVSLPRKMAWVVVPEGQDRGPAIVAAIEELQFEAGTEGPPASAPANEPATTPAG